MAKCSYCHKEMNPKDVKNGMHYKCFKEQAPTITEASTGSKEYAEPGTGGKISFQLAGTLVNRTLTSGDEKFLWRTASANKGGLQVCGTKGSYCHESGGASRMTADRDARKIMSVFYTQPATDKIIVHGLGRHLPDSTATYSVEWSDGSRTQFDLGSSKDKGKPDQEEKKNNNNNNKRGK